MQGEDTLEPSELVGAIEAVVFAAGEPINLNDLKRIFVRMWGISKDEEMTELAGNLKEAVGTLKEKWATEPMRGFELAEIADGLTFRSNAHYAAALRAMREQRPARLSKAALETLAIVAYRQPVTKPEADHVRGVDCGGTLRMLLDRGLVRIVGKKEEPGRPLLYGTSKLFLSFFNLKGLNQMPTLREFHELSEDSVDEMRDFERTNLKDLTENAKKMTQVEEPAVVALEDAMSALQNTEGTARDALAGEGVTFVGDESRPPAAAPEPTEPAEEPAKSAD